MYKKLVVTSLAAAWLTIAVPGVARADQLGDTTAPVRPVISNTISAVTGTVLSVTPAPLSNQLTYALMSVNGPSCGRGDYLWDLGWPCF